MFRKRESGPASPSQGGQILLIVILVVIIALTLGLSTATRSITSLRTSTEEAESQKALAAAEAGIERSIQGNVSIGNTVLNNNSSYSTEVTPIQGSSFLINGGNIVPKDEGADVWLVNHNADGSIDYSSVLSPPFLHLYWGTTSDVCATPTAPSAIQVIVFSNAGGTIKTYRYVYDSCSRGNNFASPVTGSFSLSGKTFTISTPEGSSNDLAKSVTNIVLLRVVPIYKDAVIGISACNHAGGSCTLLPTHGSIDESTGIAGSATRKISAFVGYPQIYLPYLSYGLFVPIGL